MSSSARRADAHDLLMRTARAHDASHYLLRPERFVLACSVDDVIAELTLARGERRPLTFRSGGTSLSGQAGSSSTLIDTRQHFRDIRVLDEGRRVVAGPGATVRAVNAHLRRHGTRLGPDPASEVACTIGGVVANNSSGMSCGTHSNTYRTMDGLVFVLPSGTVVDSLSTRADEELLHAEPEIYRGLERIRERIRSSEASTTELRRLHAIKNTMGYGLNAFLDYDDPVDILAHLMIGSEGTLGFVAQATFRTVPLHSHVATGLLIFDRLGSAIEALSSLIEVGFAAIELMDASSLRVAQRDPDAPRVLRELDVDAHAALLVEFQEADETELRQRVDAAEIEVARLPLVNAPRLTTDPAERHALWRIRKGLFTAVAEARPSGTTALLEDIAVPISRLSAACDDLLALFDTHGYRDSVIFGHAGDGNLHFLINERFDRPENLDRYATFTLDLVDLVLGHGGTLKAEHGTGRIMAPFVRRQYGDELYAVMWELKRLIDPQGIMNPGVVLTTDPNAHLADLKITPTVDEEVDRCVECGYCEPTCPSKDLTLTPRDRIVLRRESQRARSVGDHAIAHALDAAFAYEGVDTCAVDGLCQMSCPVLINTGDLVRRLRAERQGTVAQKAAAAAAAHWDGATRAASIAMTAARAMPTVLPALATRAGRSLIGPDIVPLYTSDLPEGGQRRVARSANAAQAVFFPSCTSTMFGAADSGGLGASGAFAQLCDAAGVSVRVPDGIGSLCCGTPWKSKGLISGQEVMGAATVAALQAASDDWSLPIVCDASSCSEGLVQQLESASAGRARVLDAIAFVDQELAPLLPTAVKIPSLTLHPTCSSTRLGIDDGLRRLAELAADEVIVPVDAGCCAFAGDRGMLHPELTESATAREAAEVSACPTSGYASTNRTCEIGMSRATGVSYRHILEVLAAGISSSSPTVLK